MKILIMGGTVFLGRHLVESALALGHQVTIFHRGKNNPGLFGNLVATVLGDRENINDLEKLSARKFDAVVDTCAYFPASLKKAMAILRPRCSQYVFISTISVYRDEKIPGSTEDYPLAELPALADEGKLTNETYGPLKALCERVATQVFGQNALIIRPGYIVGPYDQFDRFNFWPVSATQKRPIICPGNGNDWLQFIDVRDLADWTIRLVEQQKNGTYNATGNAILFRDFVENCRAVAQNEFPVRFIQAAILEQLGMSSIFPLWIGSMAGYAGYCRTDITKAKATGLCFRPLPETLQAILAWHKTRGTDYRLKDGPNDEQYARLLETR